MSGEKKFQPKFRRWIKENFAKLAYDNCAIELKAKKKGARLNWSGVNRQILKISIYYSPQFAVRFSFSTSTSFSNTVVYLSNSSHLSCFASKSNLKSNKKSHLN
tara:strand:+ start:189 stop:500 length:312 start_codon:yes stop_codon:yes gene_type:complete